MRLPCAAKFKSVLRRLRKVGLGVLAYRHFSEGLGDEGVELRLHFLSIFKRRYFGICILDFRFRCFILVWHLRADWPGRTLRHICSHRRVVIDDLFVGLEGSSIFEVA